MLSVRPERLAQAAASLLEAAVVSEAMPDALQALADATGSTGAVLHHVGTETVSACSPGFAEVMAEFLRIDQSLNQRMVRGLALTARGFQGFMTERDCFSEDAFADDLLQQEFYEPRRLCHYAGCVVAAGAGAAMPLVFERSRTDGRFSREDIDHLNALLPVLRAAGALGRRRIEREHRRLLDVMDLRGEPAALIADDGRVLACNGSFDALAAAGITIRHRRLCLADSGSHDVLRMACERLARAAGAPMPTAAIVIQHDLRSGQPILLELLPLVGMGRDIFDSAAALVVATNLGPGRPDPTAIRAAFGLTNSEAQVALAFATGASLEEIARATGRSHETVRSHLKALFRKTGTSRQSELAMRIARFRRSADTP